MSITILLLIFAGVGVGLACVRVAQTRCVARIQQQRMTQLTLRRTLHDRQLGLARLRTPEQIRSRVARFELRVRAPEDPAGQEGPGGGDRYALAD